MYKLILCVFSFFLITACSKKPERADLLRPGISLDMAIYRKQQVSEVVYGLSFKIPESKDSVIKSVLNLSLKIHNLDYPLYLDFNEDESRIKSVFVNDVDIPISHQKEHVIIDSKYLELGVNTVKIGFDAGELSLNRNDDYLYTLLVPDRASTLFPCFDQPDIKANYVLDITAPKEWQVLCGANIDFQETEDDFIKYQFKKSDKMSTYLFSFVAGKFNKTNKELGGLNMHMLYRENNKEKLKASTDEIFKLHEASVLFLEDYTQYKFPFQKLDFAAIPGYQYGGMEHVGAIQYRESSLFLDANGTQNQELNRSKLIAHETAHMWFGDLVTMKWFDDVWLKEVFANFLADKVTRKSFPEINHQLNFLSDHYGSAYSEDRTQGTTPIKQKLDNLKNAGTLYGRIIYNKAPIMMRQLEALLGEASFAQGMRNYIKTYANDNAAWGDLIALLEAETSEDLKAWSKVWVNESGRPIISDAITYKNNKIQRFEISQKAEDGSTHIWPQTFQIGLVYNDSVKVVPVRLNDRKQVLEGMAGLPRPNSIIYNYDAFGYGVFPIKNLDVNTIPFIKDDLARGYSYINLYENVLSGTIDPQKALNVFIYGVSSEKEELILNMIIGRTIALFWNYIGADHLELLANELVSVLKERLGSQGLSSSCKKTLFGLFKSVAYKENGLEVLYQIWDKSLIIRGLNLNENDYTDLAALLAIYKHSDANAILREALRGISNPDRKKRFEFLLPALSNDEAERDTFVLSLAKAENREKESWVGSALFYINHPLRQKSAQKHLPMYLDLLEEIQLTGDIFFPKSWLNATIGNYTSEYAYKTVEQFLTDKPDFSEVLKNKLLQASDGVYRAKLIREKYHEPAE